MAAVEFVDSLTPPWAKGARTSHWLAMFRLGAVVVDIIIEGVWQGLKAAMPNAASVPGIDGYGGFEDVKALQKYVAPDAGVYQGLTEDPTDLARRVRHAQDAAPLAGGWPTAGSVFGLLEQLAGVLGPTPPLMRVVNRAGDWWSRLQDGTYRLQRVGGKGLRWNADGSLFGHDTTDAQPWDWDSTTAANPPYQGSAGDWWLILYMPLDTPYGTTGPYTCNSGAVLGHVWNALQTYTSAADGQNPEAATWGSNSPSKLVAAVFNVIAQRQTEGFRCNHVIVTGDTSQFLPDGSSTLPVGALGDGAYPTGFWGWDTRADQLGVQSISRNSTAIYWRFPYL